MIKFGIDGRALEGNLTGIGRYIYQLCIELDLLIPTARFYVYSRKPITVPLPSERWVNRIEPVPLFRGAMGMLWIKFLSWRLIREDELDIFWGAASVFPLLNVKVKKLITVYDLNYKVVPETMPFQTYIGFKLFFKADVRKADLVFTISNGTSKRLEEYFGRHADAVVKPCVDKNIFYPEKGVELERKLSAYGINFPYILAVATKEPRKNLDLIIQCFIGLKSEKLIDNLRLILVGGPGWKTQPLSKIVEKYEEDIINLGFIEDEMLRILYSGTKVFIFPSKYEGFGMPVSEARACGAVVVTSNIPELVEAGGNGVIYVNPVLEDLKAGIYRAVSGNQVDEVGSINFECWEHSAHKMVAEINRLTRD